MTHIVLVRMSTDASRGEEVACHLREDALPRASSRPGLVSGGWLLPPDGERGAGVLVLDSREAAEQAADWPRGRPYDAAQAWNIDAVDTFEEVAAG